MARKQHIAEIFEELEHTSGRNDKIAILKKATLDTNTNRLIKLIFSYALDPFKVYGIKKIPNYKKADGHASNIRLDKAILLLDDLHNRKYTGKKATNHLQWILEQLSDDESFIIERIIGRDMKVGVLASTVNKVWPKLIPIYPCMLCVGFNEKTVQNIEYPAVVQEKLDGMRVNFIVEGKKLDVRSRNGKAINLNGYLAREFVTLSAGRNYMFDGELLVLDKEGKEYLPRKEGNGIVNKAMKGTLPIEDIRRIVVVLWDVVELSSFKEGIEKDPYRDRYNYLKSIVGKLNSNMVRLVSTLNVDTFDEAQAFYSNVIKEGGEGTILKNWSSPWENKRSKHQIKMKVENECDLKIVELMEGEGKYVGKLGSFVCESADGLLRVNVGSGFSDAQRDQLWDRNNVGKIVAVKYNEKITSRGRDEVRLFLPIFIELRDDKDEADTLDRIA